MAIKEKDLPVSGSYGPGVYVRTVSASGASQKTGFADMKEALDPTIDSALSKSSTNPVQNKVITGAVNDLKEDINIVSEGNSYILQDIILDEFVDHSGDFVSYNGWNRTDYIEVTEGEYIYYSGTVQSGYNAYFDEDKNYLSYFQTNITENSRLLVPTNAKYVIFSNTKAGMNGLHLWRLKSGAIDDSQMSVNRTYSSEKITDMVNGSVEFIMPSDVYAVVGSEFNIYFENILKVDNIKRYGINVNNTSIRYDLFSDRLRVVPNVSMVGNHNFTISVKLKNQDSFATSIATKAFTLHILPKSALSNKKVIFIGDSLTNNGVYPAEIEHILSNDGVESIGTITSNPTIGGVQYTVNHEGRGGWSAVDYTTQSSKNGVDNAFWNPSSNKFDFSYYMNNNSFSGVNAVFLNLGTNQGYYQQAETIAALKEMITSIHAYNANMPVIVSLIPPPATQDGYTYVSHGGSALQFEIGQRKLNQMYLEEFNGVLPNVYVTPVFFNLDRYHDFPTAQFPVSARNPELVTLQIESVHPSVYGYLKFADVYWATIQMLLS